MLAASYNFVFFFAAGCVFGAAAVALVAMAAGGLWLGPMPPGYLRAMRVVAIVLAVASAVVGYASISEYVYAYRGGNRYEIWALLRNRAAGPVTDLVHWVHPAFPRLPWAPYWWAYYYGMAGILVPQLLWIPSVRKRPLPVLCIALLASIQVALERLVTWFTHLHLMP